MIEEEACVLLTSGTDGLPSRIQLLYHAHVPLRSSICEEGQNSKEGAWETL